MAAPCTGCGAENPERARFCMACGEPLARRCPSCGAEAPPAARFCMECGARLDGEPAPAPRPSPAPAADAPPPEERRTVSVVFADLSGYTAIAEAMDPEAVKGLVDRSLRRLGQEVDRYGGTVDKYIGDNVMALFGAPVAHEDDAERAVRAALGMQAAMVELNAGLEATRGVALALRVGVNTGEVLAGAVGDRSYTVIGDTVNVAARLQAAARPGSVTVGEATWLATRDAIRYRELEPLALKGKARPVPAWEAVAVRAVRPARRDVSASGSPLVGRETELALLGSLFAQVERERRAQLVTIVGEAGVGKSRLVAELTLGLALREPSPRIREGRCLPYGSAVTYWAMGEVVRAEAGITEGDGADDVWEKLCRFIASLNAGADAGVVKAESDRIAALIARMLGMELPPAAGEALAEDPQRMRESFFSAVRWGIETMAQREPVVLVFEDIHWADDGMLDLIEFLAQWVRAPLLIVCLARDELLERRPSWGGGRLAATSILLEPLTGEESRELVAALLPPERQTPGAIELVADRSGGNPLFAEEMAHLVGREDAGAERLPTTVHAVLAARLDSLDRFERRLVQHAAVAGRTFWEGWLEGFAREEGGDLAAALASLEEREIVVPSGQGASARLAGERELAFRHVLIRDVAYGMLPKAVRARKHFALGQLVEQRAGDRADEVVGLIAEHYARAAAVGGEAGLPPEQLEPLRERALRFLVAAGDAAAALYSNAQALSHYRTARELGAGGDQALLATVGEREGDVCLRLGRVDAAVELWQGCLAHQRGQEDLVRIGELHRKLGGALWHKGERRAAIEHYQRGINLLKDGEACAELVRLYEDAASLYLHTGENMLAVFAAEKALALAESLGETRAASRAHGIFGRVHGRVGEMEKARESLERSVELARAAGESGTVAALLALGRHLEVADAAAAREAYGEALALAERIGDLPARVELLGELAQLAAQRGEWAEAERAASESAALAEREGLVGKLCYPLALKALLAWRAGDFDAAARLAREAGELSEQAGWSEVSYAALSTLALALRDRGDLDEALAVLERALDLCERAGFLTQSVHALAERALVQCVAGRMDAARTSAAQAGELAGRLRYPAGEAAALEARGLTSEDPDEGVRLLHDALERWGALDRPLERARCSLVLAHVLLAHEDDRARDALDAAGSELERLGIAHLAAKARTQALATG